MKLTLLNLSGFDLCTMDNLLYICLVNIVIGKKYKKSNTDLNHTFYKVGCLYIIKTDLNISIFIFCSFSY